MRSPGEISEEHARDDVRQINDDVRTVLSTPAGRRLLMAALNKAGIYRNSGPQDPARMNYEAGRREAGLDMLTVANQQARPLVEVAQKERNDLMERRNAELENARKAMTR